MKFQELNNEELTNVNGGLLGINLTAILGASVSITSTDANGNTTGLNLNLGLGGLLGGLLG